jgi:hypothetical protein
MCGAQVARIITSTIRERDDVVGRGCAGAAAKPTDAVVARDDHGDDALPSWAGDAPVAVLRHPGAHCVAASQRSASRAVTASAKCLPGCPPAFFRRRSLTRSGRCSRSPSASRVVTKAPSPRRPAGTFGDVLELRGTRPRRYRLVANGGTERPTGARQTSSFESTSHHRYRQALLDPDAEDGEPLDGVPPLKRPLDVRRVV